MDRVRRVVAARTTSENRWLPLSLHAAPSAVIPAKTRPGGRAAIPTGKPSRRMRDTLGPLSTHPHFATLFAHTGRPAEAPAPLALLTIRPFAEGLADAQAADAVRARMDWHDALALDVT